MKVNRIKITNYYVKRLIIFQMLCFLTVNFVSAQNNESTVSILLKNKKHLSIQACSEKVFRIRLSSTDNFQPTLMERYGIIKKDWNATSISNNIKNGKQIVKTADFEFIIDETTGTFSVNDSKNNAIIESVDFLSESSQGIKDLVQSLNKYFGKAKKGGGIIGDENYTGQQEEETEFGNQIESNGLAISLKKDEFFYGAGSASRNTVQHRGTALRIWTTYKKSEAAMPFLLSSNGWGIFNNNTFKNYFDVGNFKNDQLYVVNTDGEIDFYLMLGKSMTEVIELYTGITGKPYLLPKWAYGLAFGSNIMENQFNVFENALRFRNEQIPLDIYWLEPQWMEKRYDFSTEKDWNTDLFQADYTWLPDPNDPKRSNLYVNRMKDLGFKTALWLCVDHDLSIEEEDHLAKKQGKPQSGHVHWFEHLNKFIDQGVMGFKLDPGRTLDEHPDRQYHNGKTDAEMHNINQVLLQKQMYSTFRDHTGLRSFHHYCGGYAGSQHWGAATVGDNGGYIKSLYDVINHSFSGNSNMAIDVLEDVADKAPGIHYSFFTPWVQLNSWAWILHPWYYNEYDKNMFRFYAQLRYSLIPYIYSAAINSSLSGQPIVWPMALAFPDEPKVSNTLHQFMFGENLLVGAYTDSVYLPEGNWINYWTGEKHKGEQLIKGNIPEDRGGPLFIKAGSIIPYQKPVQYIDKLSQDTLILKVYPEKETSYTLLEDDGISFDYEKGQVGKTKFTSKASSNDLEFIIHPTQGDYEKKPEKRVYELEIAWPVKPKRMLLNGKTFSKWTYDNEEIKLLLEMNTNDKSVIQLN